MSDFLPAIFILNKCHGTLTKHSKSKAVKMGRLNLTRWHSIALDLLVEKMAPYLVKLAKISSTIKGYHFFKSSNFGEILKCVLELGNKHSRSAINVLSTKGKTIWHVPETLTKILAPEMAKKTMLSLEAEVTGSPRHSLEGKWVLVGEIEISCTYK